MGGAEGGGVLVVHLPLLLVSRSAVLSSRQILQKSPQLSAVRREFRRNLSPPAACNTAVEFPP